MDLLQVIKDELDDLAPQLRPGSQPRDSTNVVHKALAELARGYAKELGVDCGPVDQPHERNQTIVVCGKYRNEGEFLFDQCWLMFHCDAGGDDIIPGTMETKPGYLISCELAVETEWHGNTNHPTHSYPFHRDFRKLVVGKAKSKLFIFKWPGSEKYDVTVAQLQAQIKSIMPNSQEETYLISCFRSDPNRFVHRRFDGYGNEC